MIEDFFKRQYSEKQILEGILANNSRVLTFLYDKIFRLAKSEYSHHANFIDMDVIVSMTSDTLRVFTNKVEIGGFVENNYKGFCRNVIRNLLKQELNRKKLILYGDDDEVFDLEDDLESVAAAETLKSAQWSAVLTAFKFLSDDCQKIISSTVLSAKKEALSFKEVGEQMGKSEGAARKFKHDCMRSLKQHVKNNNINLN